MDTSDTDTNSSSYDSDNTHDVELTQQKKSQQYLNDNTEIQQKLQITSPWILNDKQGKMSFVFHHSDGYFAKLPIASRSSNMQSEIVILKELKAIATESTTGVCLPIIICPNILIFNQAWGDLADLLQLSPTFPFPKTILADLLSGTQFIHQHHIVHRDIKPCNILIFISPIEPYAIQAKLTDFGLSELFHTNRKQLGTMAKGSPGHLAPHICEMIHEVHHNSEPSMINPSLLKEADYFALALVFVRMINNELCEMLLTINGLYFKFQCASQTKMTEKMIDHLNKLYTSQQNHVGPEDYQPLNLYRYLQRIYQRHQLGSQTIEDLHRHTRSDLCGIRGTLWGEVMPYKKTPAAERAWMQATLPDLAQTPSDDADAPSDNSDAPSDDSDAPSDGADAPSDGGDAPTTTQCHCAVS